MLIADVYYKKPLQEVEKLLIEDRAFLQKYYEQGLFITSGPKHPRTGGVIITYANEETMRELIKEDPFYINGIAEYKFISFNPNRCCDEFKPIFNQERKQN